MGLDMYLTKKTYVKNWDHMQPEKRYTVSILRGDKQTHIKSERVTYIEEEIIYWRKSNAIHAWFVDNCQGGKDECQTTYISRDDLKQLLKTVESILSTVTTIPGDIHIGTSWNTNGKHEHYDQGEVISDTKVAEELLPTRSGFFFGGTDYDQFYLDDLRYTAEKLREVLAEPSGGEFYYSASW